MARPTAWRHTRTAATTLTVYAVLSGILGLLVNGDLFHFGAPLVLAAAVVAWTICLCLWLQARSE